MIEERRKFIINFTYLVIILAIVLVILRYILPVLSPFAFALLFAYVLNRPISAVNKRARKIPRRLIALFFVILFYGVLGSILFFFGAEITNFAINLVEKLPTFYDEVILPEAQLFLDSLDKFSHRSRPEFQALMAEMETKLIEKLGDMVSSVSGWALGFLTKAVTKVPAVIVNTIVMIISTFFLTMDYEKVYGFLLNQLGEKSRRIVMEVENYVVGTLFVCIRSYAIIMSITFIELSVLLTIVGIRNSILVAAGIAVFDILPVLGTGGIMLPWVCITAVQGRFGLALSLLCVYLFVTVVRNIIEPKIVGGSLGLHPVLTLSSMFLGINVFGALGLFGLPITLSLLKHLTDKGMGSFYKASPKADDKREAKKKREKKLWNK